MMFFLRGNVAPELWNANRLGREYAVSCLPMKIAKRSILALDPFRRLLLETLEKVRGRDRSSEAAEDMAVILDSSDDQGGRLQIPTGPTEVRV